MITSESVNNLNCYGQRNNQNENTINFNNQFYTDTTLFEDMFYEHAWLTCIKHLKLAQLNHKILEM